MGKRLAKFDVIANWEPRSVVKFLCLPLSVASSNHVFKVLRCISYVIFKPFSAFDFRELLNVHG